MGAVETRKALAPFERFMGYRRFSAGLAFTHDGSRVLFVSNISGQFNVWSTDGGWPQQLTAFTDATVRLLDVSPRDGTIALCADQDGDEFYQLYLVDPSEGWPEQITDAPQVQHFVGRNAFSPEGTKLAYAANARTDTDMETWIRDVDSGETRWLFGEGLYTLPAAWSPDGTKLLVFEFRDPSNTSIHLVEVESGAARELTPHDEPVACQPGPWAADGSGFYFLSDEGREFKGLAFYDLASDSHEWVEAPDADVEDVAASRDGRVLAWLVNEDGWDVLKLRDLEAAQDLPAVDMPPSARQAMTGYVAPIALTHDGSRAAVVMSGTRRPGDVWLVDTGTGSARTITDSRTGMPREDDLVDVEPVTYPTFDGRDIPAWLYRPSSEGPVPVVLSIHGGPHAQERALYHPLYQYLLSRGIAVLATNIRGSTGYGKTYERLVQRDWGGGDLQDWDYANRWLREQEWVDPDRIGVYGGSYGGFAVLTCVTRLPDRWAAAVDIVGPSNLVTFTKAVPPTWRRMTKVLVGDPEEDAELLRERSPITYVENVQTPLLVMQGAKDPRVVKPESDQMVEKLRSLGREVEYVVFEDEGHGFTKRQNELTGFKLAADWFEQHLLPG